MRDFVYVLVTIGFFALAALFVRACAWIVGGDDAAELPADATEAEVVA